MVYLVFFAEVMKGCDYKNLKHLVANDQTDVGKTKKRKQAKDSSKSNLGKTSVKSMKEQVKRGNVKVEVVHLDGPKVAHKIMEENNAVKGATGM